MLQTTIFIEGWKMLQMLKFQLNWTMANSFFNFSKIPSPLSPFGPIHVTNLHPIFDHDRIGIRRSVLHESCSFGSWLSNGHKIEPKTPSTAWDMAQTLLTAQNQAQCHSPGVHAHFDLQNVRFSFRVLHQSCRSFFYLSRHIFFIF